MSASDYTGHADLLPLAPASARPTRLTMYDYLWRWDTDWFWCSGAFGLQQPARPPALAAALAAQRRLPPDRRPGEPLRRDGRALDRPAASRPASGWSRTSRCPSSGRADVPALVRRARRDAPGVAVPAACATPRDWPSYPLQPGPHLRQRRLLGHRPDRARRRRRRREPRRRGRGRPSSAATSRSTPTPTTTGRRSTGSTAAPT